MLEAGARGFGFRRRADGEFLRWVLKGVCL
jgi:hypothetical protein